jgi:hypothetical protein
MTPIPREGAHLSFPGIHGEGFTIYPARYAKGKVAVTCPSKDGWKTRAARLIGDGLNGRYTGREHAYIVSPACAERFQRLYEEGWDASAITGALIEPDRK